MIRKSKYFDQLIIWTSVIGLVMGMSSFLSPKFNNVQRARAAASAQVNINDDLYTSSTYYGTSPRVVFVSDTTAYAFYSDATSSGTVNYKKSTDGGATWGGEVVLSSNTDANYRNFASIAVWYDQWTPGDTTGTKIYIAAQETYQTTNDDFLFKSLDTNGDTLSPTGTTWTKIADGTTDYLSGSNGPVSITKSTEGRLFAVTCVTGALDVYVSSDGSSWSATSSNLDALADYNQLLPIGLSGGGVLLLNQDVTGNDMRTAVYDEDSNSWTSGLTIRLTDTMIESTLNSYESEYGAAINKLTGQVYFVGNNQPSNAAADIISAVISYDGTSTVTWTNRTNVYTDIGTAGLHATVAIDQHNGDLYAFYLRGTAGSAMNVYYKKSGDQGGTWGSESTAISSAAGNYQGIFANITSMQKIHVAWSDVTNSDMLAVSYAANDIPALDISDARMMLLFDGASVPAGWTSISDTSYDILYQKFPRGFSSYGNPAGSDTHDHTATITNVTAASTTAPANTSGTSFAISTHTHVFFADSDAKSILPTYRELQIIQCDAGVPSGASAIPANAIAIFDTASMPAGWTQYSAQDNNFVRGGPDGEATGGASGSHTHSVSFSSSGDVITGVGTSGANAPTYAPTTHAHSINAYTTASDDFTPLNSNIVLGQNGGSATAIPGGMLAMFSAAPSGSWTRKSGSGEDLYQRFLEAKTSYAASGGGATTHTHASFVTTTQATGSAALQTDKVTGAVGSASNHTHDVSVSLGATDNLPSYVNVMIYKYPIYTPVTRNWRWFDAENVADPIATNGGDTTTNDALASENTVPTNTRIVYTCNAIKLRLVIGETAGVGGSDVKYKLQYDTVDTFTNPVDVQVQGDTLKAFRYYDGANVNDDDAVANVRLSGSPTVGRHNEDAGTGAGSGSTFDPAASTDYEHEFTIQPFKAESGVTYYFRAQYMENSTAAGGSWVTAALGAAASYPSITMAATAGLEVSQFPSQVNLGTYTKGGAGTLTYTFQAGEELVFWDKRGTGATYNITAAKLNMTGSGDAIPGTDITWRSAVGVINGSFASDKTGFTGQAGATLDVARTAYAAGSTSDQTMRGGFYFLPSLDFANLESRVATDYAGSLVVTIV